MELRVFNKYLTINVQLDCQIGCVRKRNDDRANAGLQTEHATAVGI